MDNKDILPLFVDKSTGKLTILGVMALTSLSIRVTKLFLEYINSTSLEANNEKTST